MSENKSVNTTNVRAAISELALGAASWMDSSGLMTFEKMRKSAENSLRVEQVYEPRTWEDAVAEETLRNQLTALRISVEEMTQRSQYERYSEFGEVDLLLPLMRNLEMKSDDTNLDVKQIPSGEEKAQLLERFRSCLVSLIRLKSKLGVAMVNSLTNQDMRAALDEIKSVSRTISMLKECIRSLV
uniref:Nonstructural protein 2 n=2 Tax=Influenza D virus TaxID=1511084 RepID=A0A7D0KHX3_9ORTO|nr:nonstructural protein 2 [Influenza D virus]QDG00564.1 nonstructural protein 2 [Influenza D virus]